MNADYIQGPKEKPPLGIFGRAAAAIQRFYRRMGACVHKPYADYLLGFLFYLEAIFFLPTDPILILYCVEQPRRSMSYATIATVGSVFGGITSYALGALLWHQMGPAIIHCSLVKCIISPENFAYLAEQYRHHEWAAILIAGFTPIPYKAATLTAGFCKLSFMPFVICSAVARGARFFLLAGIIQCFGVHIKNSIDRYFNIIMIAMVIAIALTFWFLR